MSESIDTITFSTGVRSYVRDSIEAIQLLQYAPFIDSYMRGDSLTPINLFSSCYLDSAELVIFYGDHDFQAAGDISQTTLQCLLPKLRMQSFNTNPRTEAVKYHNKLEINSGEATATLKNVHCTGWNRNEQTNDVKCLDVTFQFTNEEGILPFQSRRDWQKD